MATSPLEAGYHVILHSLGLFVLLLAMEAIGLSKLAAVIWLFTSSSFTNIRMTHRLRIYKWLGGCLIFVGWSHMVPVVGVILLAVENDVVINPWLRRIVLRAEDAMAIGPPTRASLRMGVNSGLTDEIKRCYVEMEDLFYRFIGSRQLNIGLMVRAEKLRENGLSPHIEDGCSAPTMEPVEVIRFEDSYASRLKIIITVLGLLGMMIFSGTSMGLISLMTLFSLIVRGGETPNQPTIHMGERLVFSDGVYRLTRTFCGIPIDRCIGTVYNGVMHAPYHGVGLNRLMYGGAMVRPFYTDITADITTWGGMPVYGKVDPEEEVYVNCEGDGYRRTIRCGIIRDDDGNFTWVGSSQPTESGSPIWSIQDGALVLVGMAGRWVHNMGVTNEIFMKPKLDGESFEKSLDGITYITTYPGSGKTRKMVPRLVLNHLLTKKSGRVMVVGPTRVVAYEIYSALNAQIPGNVGLNIKGESDKRRPMARVQVTTHHTFLSMANTGAREMIGMEMLIIDEAHVNDVSTRQCHGYAISAAKRGVAVYELSATLNGNADKRSNFPIIDRKIKPGDEDKLVSELVAEGKRILWFVPGAKGNQGCIDKARELRKGGIEAVALCRDTLEEAYTRFNDNSVRVFVTTNIAECGMNLDVDVVINTAKEYDFFDNGGFIGGQVSTIDEASWVQRRGRVGRRKQGWHYYTSDPVPVGTLPRASETDAEILMTGRSWAKDTETASDIQLTDAQYDVWLDKNISPRVIAQFYTLRGARKKGNDLSRAISDWVETDITQTLCDCGKCPSKAKWFDMRHHDLLCEIYGRRTTSIAEEPYGIL